MPKICLTSSNLRFTLASQEVAKEFQLARSLIPYDLTDPRKPFGHDLLNLAMYIKSLIVRKLLETLKLKKEINFINKVKKMNYI